MSRREQSKSSGSKPKIQLRMTPAKHKLGQTRLKARKSIAVSRRARKKTASVSDVESTSSGGVSLDEDFDADSENLDEESDDADEPDVISPSRFTRLRGETGPKYDEDSDNLSDDSWDGFPETALSSLQSTTHQPATVTTIIGQSSQLNVNVSTFLSDDDDMYEGVNQISESEPEDDATIEKRETSMIIRELSPLVFDTDMTSHFANQIDGMSEYGFGSDSEASVGLFTESEDLFEAASRSVQVRFEEPSALGMEDRMQALVNSPTMTRALLPSALPVVVRQARTFASDEDDDDDDDDDDYDTDATEELADPETAWRIHRDNEHSHPQEPAPNTPPAVKRSSGLKFPVMGTFTDDGAKPSAILDSTGTKLIISDPHLLGGVFARRYGPSVPTSPSVGFAEAVFGSDQSSDECRPQSQPLPDTAPLSIADNLTEDANVPVTSLSHSTLMGAPLRTPAQECSLNDFLSRDIFDDDQESDPENHLNFEDMIVSSHASDSEIVDAAGSPLHQRAPHNTTRSMPGSPLSHLHNIPVTAFRQHAQLRHFPEAPEVVPLRSALTTPLKRKRRNHRHDSPYKDPHYKGVTPVQRISYAEHAELSSSPIPAYQFHNMGHKRRKTIL